MLSSMARLAKCPLAAVWALHALATSPIYTWMFLTSRYLGAKFGEDIKEWASFREGFESAVDKNPSLSDIDKFNYFRSLLESQATSCISGL